MQIDNDNIVENSEAHENRCELYRINNIWQICRSCGVLLATPLTGPCSMTPAKDRTSRYARDTMVLMGEPRLPDPSARCPLIARVMNSTDLQLNAHRVPQDLVFKTLKIMSSNLTIRTSNGRDSFSRTPKGGPHHRFVLSQRSRRNYLLHFFSNTHDSAKTLNTRICYFLYL